MSELVRSILVLMEDGRTIDGGLLLRALYEHVVKFCWIAADPETRYPVWRSDGLVQQRKLHDDALPFGFTILDAKRLAEAQAATDRLPSMPELCAASGRVLGRANRRVPTARQGRSAAATDDSRHVHPGVSHAVRAGTYCLITAQSRGPINASSQQKP
jgi:hypothetical protein